MTLDGMRVIADAERFGSDLHMHCPEHGLEQSWLSDVFGAWAWTQKGRPLREFVKSPSAALVDGVALLDAEFGAFAAEVRDELIERAKGGHG